MITFGFVTAEWLGDELRGGILSIFSKVEDAETSKDAKPEADVARDVALRFSQPLCMAGSHQCHRCAYVDRPKYNIEVKMICPRVFSLFR